MRFVPVLLVLACASLPLYSQEALPGPANQKAQKTYGKALENLQKKRTLDALEGFKKADKQDDGHCVACQHDMVRYGIEMQDWKAAETGAGELIAAAQDARSLALAHYDLGMVLNDEGLTRHKDEYFSRAHDEMGKALAAAPRFPEAIFVDGEVLAHLKQDDAAKARFVEFLEMADPEDPNRPRASRYVDRPELARARMAPAFTVTTLNGQKISMDDLQGKVVLLDFWATWCLPCREALPHMREIAKKFQGQPLILLSVSLDDDDRAWREFVAKNGMTWLQYRDGGFTGPISTLFGVRAIPHTFTIDSDGVLQDEHVGDAAIEGKLKKLIARAREASPAPKVGQKASSPHAGSSF